MWHSDDGMGWWMLWGALMMIVFWGAIITLVVWAVQALARRETGETPPPPSRSGRSNALDIAKERYARSEIGRDEFEQLKRDLDET